jgi:hypothetical protein
MRWSLEEPERLKANDVIIKIRHKVSDTLINKYSEYELLMAINEAIDIFWQALSDQYSTVTQRVKAYDLSSGQALLPSDFYSLAEIQYGCVPARIKGDHIFGSGEVVLVYNYKPREITLSEDVVDVPITLISDLVKIAAQVVAGNTAAAVGQAEESAKRISQKREVSRIPDMECFP